MKVKSQEFSELDIVDVKLVQFWGQTDTLEFSLLERLLRS